MKELKAYDAVVFDPPRAGAAAQAETLAKSEVSRLVAISCNPGTLARDLSHPGSVGIGAATASPRGLRRPIESRVPHFLAAIIEVVANHVDPVHLARHLAEPHTSGRMAPARPQAAQTVSVERSSAQE